MDVNRNPESLTSEKSSQYLDQIKGEARKYRSGSLDNFELTLVYVNEFKYALFHNTTKTVMGPKSPTVIDCFVFKFDDRDKPALVIDAKEAQSIMAALAVRNVKPLITVMKRQ